MLASLPARAARRADSPFAEKTYGVFGAARVVGAGAEVGLLLRA